eukprot:3665046-Rhodomonas_salina.5
MRREGVACLDRLRGPVQPPAQPTPTSASSVSNPKWGRLVCVDTPSHSTSSLPSRYPEEVPTR